MSRATRISIATIIVSVSCSVAFTTNAAELPPNDPSISDSLVSWLRTADRNYANGVWTATTGPNLESVGDAGDGDFYDIPELSTWNPEDGYFLGAITEASGVMFSADISDLLVAPMVNQGEPFDELTLIGVYQTTGNTDRTRPIGIGSRSEDGSVLGNAFNLSSDASLRYDNGNNQTDPTLHLPDLTFRAGVLSDGLVSDYLDGELITDEAVPGGNFQGETRNDDLYIGDVRGGINDGFAGTDPHDIFIAEVIVYNAALAEEQIVGIGEWLLANLTSDLGNGAPRLQAGDADQDLDFDQLDLVKVQIAAKYLTGQAATWGEGDWNGAPGGTQGDPPAGDGQFNQLDIVSALGPAFYLTGPYAAIGQGGSLSDDKTSLVYDATTGELQVDPPAGKELTSINITSASSKFVGDKPAVLDGAFDNFAADNLFKATFGGSFGSISFGNVLPAGVGEQELASDLSAVGSIAGGGDLGDVDLVYIPEPSSLILLVLGFTMTIRSMLMLRRR